MLKDARGRPIGLLAVIRDITERKRAEEAERFLAQASAILASSIAYHTTIQQIARLAVPILADWCTLDIRQEGHFSCVAAAHVDPKEEALLWKLRRRYPTVPEGPSPGSHALRTGQSVLYPQFHEEDLPQMTQDAEHLRLLAAVAPVSGMAVPLIVHGETMGFMTLALIRPEQRFSERDVQLAEELARRAAIAIENARLYREAKQAVRAREEFLSLASHELKTPLTTLKGSTQLLARQLLRPEPDRDRLHSYSQRFQEQLGRLETLVAELLDVSQLQQGQLELRREYFDLRGLAAAVNPARIDQVLTNLVSNALKYSPQGGEVRLTVVRPDGQVVIAERDQGVGISAVDQARLFEPFVRNEAVRGSVRGAGLGLYITRQIVEQHGGTIRVESELSHGSTFTIQFPQ